MSERAQTAKAIADLAWTAVVVAVIAYSARAEIRKLFIAKRAELYAARDAMAERAQMLERRRDFARHNRDRLIAEEFEGGE